MAKRSRWLEICDLTNCPDGHTASRDSVSVRGARAGEGGAPPAQTPFAWHGTINGAALLVAWPGSGSGINDPLRHSRQGCVASSAPGSPQTQHTPPVGHAAAGRPAAPKKPILGSHAARLSWKYTQGDKRCPGVVDACPRRRRIRRPRPRDRARTPCGCPGNTQRVDRCCRAAPSNQTSFLSSVSPMPLRPIKRQSILTG